MNNKTKTAMIILGSIATGGLFYGGYQLYKQGFKAGAKEIGERLFNGELVVDETDESGKVMTKVVDPVLRNPEDVIIDCDENVGVTYH